LIDLAALEATALAEFLKRSRWVYPLVNAGHVFGLALLVGAVLPMDVQALRRRAAPALLRAWAAAGLALAVCCGALLFVTQAGDYLQSGWFRAKMALLALALTNAALALAWPGGLPRASALASLVLWPAVLILGRMIAYG
jgi:hypothetical protein